MLRWLIPIVVLVVAVAVGLAVPALDGAHSGGWSDQRLQVVGSPTVADGMVLVLDVTSNHDLEMSAIKPSNGAVAWSHPFSASEITPGVAFTPVAIGDTVVVLAPAGGPSNPEVMVEGVNAVTGKVIWTLAQTLVFSDAPVACGLGAYFCLPVFTSQTDADLVAVSPVSGAVRGTVAGPYRNMGVAPPGSANDSSLWQNSASTPTFTQTSPTGQLLWTKSVASLFGGSQFTPDYGWDFLVADGLDVGSVGVAPVGKTEPLDGFKTIGISMASGAVSWSVPGYFLCGGGLQFLTTDLVCQYTGSAHAQGQNVSMSGVGLTLRGLDSSTGTTTWSQRVLDPESLSVGTNIAFLDGSHLVVRSIDGRRGVLNVQNGRMGSAPSNQVFWCEQMPLYRVGVTVGGMFIWPSPHGLTAEPSST